MSRWRMDSEPVTVEVGREPQINQCLFNSTFFIYQIRKVSVEIACAYVFMCLDVQMCMRVHVFDGKECI